VNHSKIISHTARICPRYAEGSATNYPFFPSYVQDTIPTFIQDFTEIRTSEQWIQLNLLVL